MIDEFSRYLRNQRNFSDNTSRAYLKDVKEFFFYHEKDFNSITRSDIISFINFLQENKKNSPQTRNRKLAAIRCYFRFLVTSGYLKGNPASDIEIAKIPKRLPKPLTSGEYETLSDIYSGETELEVRNKAIIETMFALGIRVEELVNLKLDFVDGANRTVRIIGKGNKERLNPIHKNAIDLINKYLSIRHNSSEYLFTKEDGTPITTRAISYIVKNASLKAGITRISVSPHKLRHTFATEMLNHGADIREVQELLGHENIATTQCYTEVSRTRLFQRYNDIHPRAGKIS